METLFRGVFSVFIVENHYMIYGVKLVRQFESFLF